MKKQLSIKVPPNKQDSMSPEDRALLEAHNNSKGGLRLGVQKSKRRGHLDTPLFSQLAGDQTKMF